MTTSAMRDRNGKMKLKWIDSKSKQLQEVLIDLDMILKNPVLRQRVTTPLMPIEPPLATRSARETLLSEAISTSIKRLPANNFQVE
jgi:hypothetical protein